MSGSAANTLTSHPGGTWKRLTDSSGVKYGWPEGLLLSKPSSRCARAQGDKKQVNKAEAKKHRKYGISGSE